MCMFSCSFVHNHNNIRTLPNSEIVLSHFQEHRVKSSDWFVGFPKCIAQGHWPVGHVHMIPRTVYMATVFLVLSSILHGSRLCECHYKYFGAISLWDFKLCHKQSASVWMERWEGSAEFVSSFKNQTREIAQISQNLNVKPSPSITAHNRQQTVLSCGLKVWIWSLNHQVCL